MSIALVIREPHALAAALRKAVEAHPFGVKSGWSLDSAVATETAERLWKSLGQLDGAELHRAIDGLGAPDLSLLGHTARSRLDDKQSRVVLGELLNRRTLSDGKRLAFEALVVSDGDAAFRPLATQYAHEHPTASAFLSVAVRSGRPCTQVVAAYQLQHAAFSDWTAAADSADAPVHRLCQGALKLLVSNAAAIGHAEFVEKDRVVAEWLHTVPNVADRDAVLSAYLTASRLAWKRRSGGRQPWPVAHAPLDLVLLRYKTPADGHPFWTSVEAESVEAFRLWLLDRQLTSLIGENDRLDFWRRYLPFIQRAQANRDKKVVFIDFDDWCAIQFISAGTATYCYPIAFQRGLRRLNEQEIQGKVRRDAHKSCGSYEHRGYTETWQGQASALVNSLLRKRSGEHV